MMGWPPDWPRQQMADPFLQYLAEDGVLGGLGLLALIGNHFRLARQRWQADRFDSVALALYGWAFLFGFTLLIEAGWLWGPASFPAILMAALTVRYHASGGSPEGMSTPQTN